MEIFTNDLGYVPMVVNLEGYWDKLLSDLPDNLKKIVMQGFPPLSWDELPIESRRKYALQCDYIHDPNHEHSLYFKLSNYVDKLKVLIQTKKNENNDSAVVVLRDVLDEIEEIIKVDRIRVGSEIQELRKFASDIGSKEKLINKKPHGNEERFAKNREQVLGAAIAVLTKWPEKCKNAAGKYEARKLAELLDEKAELFWPILAQPPLSRENMERELSKWLKAID